MEHEEEGHGDDDSPQWGLLTGWRMIAQDVMKELESASDDDERDNANRGSLLPCRGNNKKKDDVDDPEGILAVHNNRLKSVIAKKGENFYMDYQMMEEIGTGAFGRAIRAKRRVDQETVVVKELIGRRMTEKEIADAKNEVKVLAHLNHPNIVRYYDFYSDSGKMHIVMEFCEEGDLSSDLRARDGVLLEENEIMMKFVQICLALHHTHSQGILHRDLKSQNIFLTTSGILKLGDFGISRIMEGEQAMARSMVGTPYYLSPEMCEDKPYGPKSDIWSLGCVLYELCTLKHAFDGQSLPALVLKILSGTVPEISSTYSKNLNTLTKRLLCKDPEKRPAITEILNFDYVRTHLQHYAAHIHFSVVRRKDSFQRALEPFNLQQQPEEIHAALQFRRSTTFSVGGEIHGKMHSLPVSERAELEHWGDVDDEAACAEAFEIAPYRFYTKDEEHNGIGLRLRSTQTEALIQTPLSLEFSSNIAKLAAFQQKLLGSAAAKASQIRSHGPLIESKVAEEEDEGVEVVKLVSDGESDEEKESIGWSDDSDDAAHEDLRQHSAQHVPNVVAQIRDIMKSPSTQIEVHAPLALTTTELSH